jgi:hypothetical protein
MLYVLPVIYLTKKLDKLLFVIVRKINEKINENVKFNK